MVRRLAENADVRMMLLVWFLLFYVYFLCRIFNLYFGRFFKNASAASGESSCFTITDPVSYIVIYPIPLDT